MGSCYITQGAQPSTLVTWRGGKGEGEGQVGGDEYILMVDSCCMAEANTML